LSNTKKTAEKIWSFSASDEQKMNGPTTEDIDSDSQESFVSADISGLIRRGLETPLCHTFFEFQLTTKVRTKQCDR